MVAPTRSLPPEAEPWGRFVESEVSQIKFDAAKNAQDINNSLLSINGTLAQLSVQIAATLDAANAAAAAAAGAASAAAAAGAAAATANSAVADLAARISVSTSMASFNTGALPNDASFHQYGGSMPITIAVPTGKLIVTVGCGQATLNAGGSGAVEADATFSISGIVSSNVYVGTAYLASSTTGMGASIVVQRAFTIPPGTYTVTGEMWAWASGTSSASVNFQQPYLTVQVTG